MFMGKAAALYAVEMATVIAGSRESLRERPVLRILEAADRELRR